MAIGLCFVWSSVGLEVVCVGSFGGVKLVMVIGIGSSGCVARAGSSIFLHVFHLWCRSCGLSGVVMDLKLLGCGGGIVMIVISIVIVCDSGVVVWRQRGE